MLLLLSRLGHDLSVREDLARFVVPTHTGDVLPRLIWHVTLSVIQHNDVLHRWQNLKLALWVFPSVLLCLFQRTSETRTLSLGFGTAGLDGAYERREGHLAVLRWTKWCCVFGRGSRSRRRGPLGERGRCGELGPVEILCRHHLAGVPHFRPEARYRRRTARLGGGGGQRDGTGAAGCFARGKLALGAVCGFLGSLGRVGVLVGCFERWACEPGGLAG